jgi:hypothetical protein
MSLHLKIITHLQDHDFIILHSYDVSKEQYICTICYYATLQHPDASGATVASASQSFMMNGRLTKCFSNVFARGPLLAHKNNHGSSHPFSQKYRASGWWVSKIKNLYLRTEFRELRIHINRIRNNVLHYLTLITLTAARFVGTGCFLTRHSNDHTK